jgi:hypothetical protein
VTETDPHRRDDVQPSFTDRRLKVVRIPANQVLDWFTFAVRGYPDNVALLELGGLPDGVRVLSVQTNWYARTVDFLVAHESFDEVLEGMEPPEYPDRLGTSYVITALSGEPSPAYSVAK